MSMTANALHDLHHLHKRMGYLREQLERGPRQLEARRNHLADRTAGLEKARADLKALKSHMLTKESERKAVDSRINQLQLQINTAKSNKEYAGLVAEKDAALKARGGVEDQILELLIQEEECAKAIRDTEVELVRLQKELDEFERTTAEQAAEMTRELAEDEARLQVAEAALPSEMHETYRRVVSRRGADAMAQAQDGTCTGCYTGITPQMQNLLLLNEDLVLCKSCGRILYLEAPPVPAQ